MRTGISTGILAGVAALLAGCGGGSPPAQGAAASDEAPRGRRALLQDRFITTESTRDQEATVTALLEALDRRDLTVFAVIDHQAGAASVDLSLRPMTVVIFGNPKAGTPLMQAEPLLGAELPLRALVFTEDGVTRIAVTGTDFLRRRYELDDAKDVVDRIGDVLSTIVAEATGAA